jgi:hypothetical protein
MTTLQKLQELHAQQLQTVVKLNDEQAKLVLDEALATNDVEKQFVLIDNLFNGYDNILSMSEIIRENFSPLILLIKGINRSTGDLFVTNVPTQDELENLFNKVIKG